MNNSQAEIQAHNASQDTGQTGQNVMQSTEYLCTFQDGLQNNQKPQVQVKTKDQQTQQQQQTQNADNFLHYSNEDFESYLKYLVDDRNAYFDTKFLSRLEHQTKILKRLISLQAAQAIAEAQEMPQKYKDQQRLVAHYQQAVQNYTKKIQNIEDKIK